MNSTTDPTARDLIQRLAAGLDQAAADIDDWGSYVDDYFQQKHDLNDDVQRAEALAAEARRWLCAQPEPAAEPTDEELDLMVIAIQALRGSRHPDTHALDSISRGRTTIRRALARWGNHAPKPIPISERLPKPHDVEEKTKYCWWFNVDTDSWHYCDARDCGHPWMYWTPHWAIPVPQEESK